MTKADLAKLIQDNLGLSRLESQDMVETVLSIMKENIGAGENLKISGFGTFEVKEKKDRRGRNPQTGETITIDGRRIVTFKPSALLRTAINKGKQ